MSNKRYYQAHQTNPTPNQQYIYHTWIIIFLTTYKRKHYLGQYHEHGHQKCCQKAWPQQIWINWKPCRKSQHKSRGCNDNASKQSLSWHHQKDWRLVKPHIPLKYPWTNLYILRRHLQSETLSWDAFFASSSTFFFFAAYFKFSAYLCMLIYLLYLLWLLVKLHSK